MASPGNSVFPALAATRPEETAAEHQMDGNRECARVHPQRECLEANIPDCRPTYPGRSWRWTVQILRFPTTRRPWRRWPPAPTTDFEPAIERTPRRLKSRCLRRWTAEPERF